MNFFFLFCLIFYVNYFGTERKQKKKVCLAICSKPYAKIFLSFTCINLSLISPVPIPYLCLFAEKKKDRGKEKEDCTSKINKWTKIKKTMIEISQYYKRSDIVISLVPMCGREALSAK